MRIILYIEVIGLLLQRRRQAFKKNWLESPRSLCDIDIESNGKVEMLQNKLDYTREDFSMMEHKERQLRSELEINLWHILLGKKKIQS